MSIFSIRKINNFFFKFLVSRFLIFNSCWEDPYVDRKALEIQSNDVILSIASAGCNVLDYLLERPKKVFAIDLNFRQIALLELKLVGIKKLEYNDFFQIFGYGKHINFNQIYNEFLRPELSEASRKYWDSNKSVFLKNSLFNLSGLYYHGLTGNFAKIIYFYLLTKPKLKEILKKVFFEAISIKEQKAIYENKIEPLFWTPFMKWLVSNNLVLNLLGVPPEQSSEIKKGSNLTSFIEKSVKYVFTEILLSKNYFWYVYVFGRYSRNCCPEYLRESNFNLLKLDLIDRLEIYTGSITDFLKINNTSISKFVLLDHMDWMGNSDLHGLNEEWKNIFEKSTANARVIFRSANKFPEYLNNIYFEQDKKLINFLQFESDLSNQLNLIDRVHTYGGFHIANITKEKNDCK